METSVEMRLIIDWEKFGSSFEDFVTELSSREIYGELNQGENLE